MPDPFFAEEAGFDVHTAAEVKLWTTGPDNDQPGLIVTLPQIEYEFSSGPGDGADAGGIFSYNEIADIPIDVPTNFEVTTKGSGARTHVIVVFRKDNGDVYGRFVGADPAQATIASGLVSTTGAGNWTLT